MEEEKLGQPSTALFKYAKIDFIQRRNHIRWWMWCFMRPFHALCQSVVMTVRRKGIFIVWKEVA